MRRIAVSLTLFLSTIGLLVAQAPTGGVPEAARSPIAVPGVDHLVDAATGDHFFVLVKADGTVWTWGDNHAGQLGNGQVGATAGAEPGKTLGFVVQGRAQAIAVTDAIGAAAGGDHALVVRKDGTVWGWGSNGSGQLGLGRGKHGLAPSPVQIPGLAGVTAVAARNSASYALLTDGTVVGWGDNLWRAGNRAISSETPLAVPGVKDAVAIRAGLPCLALLRDGHVLTWGSGILGDGSAAQGDYLAPVVPQPAMVAGIDDAVAIAAGTSRSAVIRRDGTVWIWGDGAMGGLGLGAPGATPNRLVPTAIPGITGAVDLALGSGSSIVSGDGSLRTWGDQRLGATARAGIERTVVPTRVPGVDTMVRVWASSYSNLGLLRDGRVLAWGSVYVQP